MAGKEEYIGGPTGGIPESIFTPRFYDVVEGKSGERLLCNINKNGVRINGNHAFYFAAYRHYDNKNHLLLSIGNKRKDDPQKHPDIYASKLVERSILFLEEQGEPINGIRSIWFKSGDNYKTYMEQLNPVEKKGIISESDRQEAAKQTWTGKLAHSLGFTKIETVIEDPRGTDIEVLFHKQS